MRTVNRLIAAVLALGLIVVGFLSVVEIILVALGLPPLVVPYESWLDTARSSTYGDRSVIVSAIALLALGLVLIVLQLLRRPPLSYSLETKHDRVDTQIDRRSLERVAARAARDVDGVEKARCRAKAGRLAVSATTGREEILGLDGKIRAAVEDRLFALEPATTLTVSVKVQSPSGR
jgi:hypothetical protein